MVSYPRQLNYHTPGRSLSSVMAVHKQQMIFILTLTFMVLVGVVIGNKDYRNYQYASTGASNSRWLFKNLGERPETVKSLRAMVERQVGHSLPVIEHTTDTSTLCSGCTWAVDTIKHALWLGLTYEELRPLLIPICKDNVAGGNLICEGYLDNYGPHVEYVLRKTNKKGPLKRSALEVCEFMNACKINIEDPNPTTTAATTPAQPTAVPIIAERSNSGIAWHPAADIMKGTLTSDKVQREERRRTYAQKRRHAQRKTNALKIVQVADFHIDEKYAEGSAKQCDYAVCCRREFPGNGSAGHWGEYKCNVPPRTIEHFLNFTAANLNPDFLIYSGDNPPHSAWEETYESQIKVTQLAASLVEKNIFDRNGIKTYPAIGNHETMPLNLYTMNKAIHHENMTVFNQKWEEAWGKSAGFGAEQKETIHKAGYYTILLKEGLRIVCLNSNYGYWDNYYNLIQWVEDEYNDMMTWFTTTLQYAREANEKVIMVSHHDIGSNVIEFDKNLTSTLAEYKDIIVFYPVGHTHRDEFRLYFGEDSSQPAGILHVSMTMGGMSNVNPGFRMYYLDRDDYTVLDYDQYYLNLATATADAEPVKLYTFTEEYDLPDASADSHAKLWNKLRRDPALMARYWNTKRLRTGADGPCDKDCVIAELCRQVSQTWKHFLTCEKYYGDEIVKTPTPPPSTDAPTSTGTPASTKARASTKCPASTKFPKFH